MVHGSISARGHLYMGMTDTFLEDAAERTMLVKLKRTKSKVGLGYGCREKLLHPTTLFRTAVSTLEHVVALSRLGLRWSLV